ncbi:hypothetical protein [Neoroseomonas rubea]|uniref:hypothetical protein n=1 Tax=Neoroseomonas rubea TaxID=2748666 RepID=UPI0018E041D9|nr:hypothetical protein [Roseomonas rubea]
MPGLTHMTLGAMVTRRGDITKNRFVGARCARDVERSLGFGAGRLAQGWAVLVLKDRLTPADFKFSGTTLRSGGRLGLPADTAADDAARPHVADVMRAEYGATHVERMQQLALASVTEKGPDRIVKVVPVQDHDSDAAPSAQYPMGGGGLQWTLTTPKTFLVAMTVSDAEIATIPDFSAFIGPSAPYDARARIARWLDQA